MIRSVTNKTLNEKNLVIIDSLNYIKGFRYELYTIARTNRTRHCSIYLQESL